MRNSGSSWRCDNAPPAGARFFRDRAMGHNFSDVVHDPFRCWNHNSGAGLSERDSLRLAEELRMKIPEEFVQFVRGLHPDLDRDSGSLESLAAAGLEYSDVA